MEINLDKGVIAGTVVNYFHSPEFPECIYISLENSFACGNGTVINTLNDMESTLDFTPLANITELIKNIPSREEYKRYFNKQFAIMSTEDITWEMEKTFWDGYPFQFTASVRGIKINWE